MRVTTAYRVHQINGQEVITGQEHVDAELVDQIAASMAEHGWVGVPVITYRGLLLTGNHRCVAADQAGTEIESIDLIDLLLVEGISQDAIDETIEDYQDCGDYSVAEELAALIPACEFERLGIDFGRHN